MGQGGEGGLLDHPRSRGVYEHSPHRIAASSGSSPLARGLRSTRTLRQWRPRIIPARAGFTECLAARDAEHTDHPRSRGVYLLSRVRACMRARIIPARAGFTWGSVDGVWAPGDHPRSRGVYSSRLRTVCAGSGSSPLARGLQVLARRALTTMGIIPARAGFTPSGPTPSKRAEDHPRSRGVYQNTAAAMPPSLGSSPLARGLPLGPVQ